MPSDGFPIHPDQNARQSAFEGIRIREDSVYSNARGKEKGGIRKRAEKGLHELRDVLMKVLRPGECVFYLARAQAMPSKLEEFFLGWLAYTTHRGLLVFTNQRLLYFITDGAGRWKKSLRAANWGDIETAKASGWLNHTLRLKYRDGASETFWKLRGDDIRKIKVLLAALLPASTGETSSALGMVSLCPQCLTPLRAGVYRCGNCNAQFKDEAILVRRSRLFPWLGYAYIGYPGLAVLDFIIEAILLFEIGIRLYVIVRILMLPHLPAQAPAVLAGLGLETVFFTAIWAFKRWLMLRQCRRFVREFIPAT
jgi:hypothetical protein